VPQDKLPGDLKSVEMWSTRKVTFAILVNNREVFEKNLLASPCLRPPCDYQILVLENRDSAGKAYNEAMERSLNDLIVFCHQDIFLPDAWLSEVARALDWLEEQDPKWGVLGCYGETRNDNGRGYIYSSGCGIMGRPFEHPAQVQTLDEIVLILRKSSGLRFDDSLPHFHLYGTDICLRAEKFGMKSYAICAFCIHNTHQNLILPREFYECCKHVKRTWRQRLPIQATCIRITKFGFPLQRRRLREIYLRHIRRKECGGIRASDPQELLMRVEVMLRGK
jgi:hypothetical protein